MNMAVWEGHFLLESSATKKNLQIVEATVFRFDRRQPRRRGMVFHRMLDFPRYR